MLGLLKNRRLNPGGILGAIVFVFGTIMIAVYLFKNKGRIPAGACKLIVFAALGGGLFGNWLWRLAFGSDNWEPPHVFEVNDERKRQ